MEFALVVALACLLGLDLPSCILFESLHSMFRIHFSLDELQHKILIELTRSDSTVGVDKHGDTVQLSFLLFLLLDRLLGPMI
jgi:hypothetical protein